MQEYLNKKELINEINKRANLFINEFKEIKDENKDTSVEGVDRSPAQMIAYQLGWMKLVLSKRLFTQSASTGYCSLVSYQLLSLA